MALTEFTNKLLKEAIADAEAVRQTAIENAKLSLEETFTPQIKSMLSRRLRAEAEGTESEEEKDVETQEAPEAEEKEVETKAAPAAAPKMETAKEVPHEEAEGESKSGEVPMDTSAIASSDNAEPSDDASDSSEIGTGPEAETDNSVDWYDDWSESDFDLDEVIKELEADLNDLNADDTDEAYPAEEPEAGAKKPEIPAQSSSIGKDESHIEPSVPSMEDGDEAEEAPEAPEAPMAPDAEAGSKEGEEGEEELDLEVILKELEADEMQKTADSEKMASLEKELAEYRQAVQLLRGKLNEVNLLNAKLLYTNKILHKEGLNDEQKVMVVENFDRATSVREVKMVYAVLVETLTSVAKVAKATKSTTKVVAEGLASKATPSTAPKAAPTEVIAENSVAKRLQQLAGLI